MKFLSSIQTSAVDINALLEFSRLLNQSDDLDRIYGTALLSLMGKLRFSRGAVAVPIGEGFFIVEQTRGSARSLTDQRFRWEGKSGYELCQIQAAPAEVASVDLHEHGISYILPICFAEKTFALLLLGSPLVDDSLSENQENYALVIAAITSIAVEGALIRSTLHDTNRRLERRVRRLHSVFESSRAFGGLLEGSEIARLLGYTLMGEMAIARYALYLREGRGYRAVVNRFREEASDSLLGKIQDGEEILLDEESWPHLHALGARAALPLKSQGETEGILLIGERLQYGIDAEDLEYLGALGALAISSLENARLLDEMIEKRRLEEDLRIAWEIQQQLLPSSLPEITGYSIFAGTLPARQVGGDCYDVISIPDGRLLIAIADVSGKGTPASLLMANVQAALRALAPLGLSLDELAGRVNDLIHDNTAPDKFITAFIALLDPDSGRLEYVNAGHNPPFHVTGEEITPLSEGGLILGVMPTTIPYLVGACELKEGEGVVMYTDGVSEAMNDQRDEYGDDRLIDLLRKECSSPADRIFNQVQEDVRQHVGNAAQSDDITIIALTRNRSN